MSEKLPLRLRGLESVEVLGRTIPAADGLCSRLLGLSFLDRENAGAGLFIARCRSVHTFGMRFELDIHFVDERGCEVRRLTAVPEGRVVFCRGATGVLELTSDKSGRRKAGPQGGRVRSADDLEGHAP